MHDYTANNVKKALFDNNLVGSIPQNDEGWTKEFLDWSNPNNQNIKRHLEPAMKWQFIGNQKEVAQGKLIGGCVEVLQTLNNTMLWPAKDMWSDSILFLETSEYGMSPIQLKRFLYNLAAQDILPVLNGILFARPGGTSITADQFKDYDQVILEVFSDFNIPLVPIVTRMDFGHSDPMCVLPFGVMAEINPVSKTVTILENGVI